MDSQVTKRQLEIVDAAGKILTSSGIGGLTIKSLAEQMGFSESALYRHFKNKEDIIITMLNHLANHMDNLYSQRIIDDQNPDEKLIALFTSQFKFFSRNPHFVVTVFSDGLMEESNAINNAILKIMEVKKKHLLPIIADGQQQGIFTQLISEQELMSIIMGTIRLQMFKWRVSHFKYNIEQRGLKTIQSLLTLIKS